MDCETCKEHSGCIARIEALEKSDSTQWEHINDIRKIVAGRLNVVLGGIVAALVLLVLNLAIGK